MLEQREQRLVQQLVTQTPIEAFHECILLRLSRCDVMPFNPGQLRPAQDGYACELGPVVADNHRRGPRRAITASSSRPTRAPDNEVTAINAMHSRVKSSTTARMRNRRLSVSVSLTKSSDQRRFGPCGNVNGALVPSALLRPPRRRT